MKNPFAILLAAAAVLGIIIAIVVILVLQPSDETDDETIPVASQSDLPTPTTRNEALSRESAQPTPTPAVAQDETPDQAPEAAQTDAAPDTQGGRGGFGGGGFGAAGGGPGGGNFQAIQQAMADNPELAELFQKAQSGDISQEEQARMRELMQELLAEAGIEAPGAGQGRGFGAPPTQGTISAISGSTVTIDHAADSGLSTDIEITENTNINVIEQLTPADLTEGTNVAGTVQRGEGGRIFIVNLAVIPEQPRTVQGFGRGFLAPLSLPASGNDATNISTIDGIITEINDQQISVETTQGTLRLTTNEDSTIISTNPGTISDITQGMAAIALGDPPNNLIVGPEFILQ